MDCLHCEKKEKFARQFKSCGDMLSAIGDETRQSIILTLIENAGKGGLRVGEIRMNTNLSRPAVSHHLKVLKDAGVINLRKDGTKNYYYLDGGSVRMKELIALFRKMETVMENCRMLQSRQNLEGSADEKGEGKYENNKIK